jgi:hypothetical protein
MDGATGEGGGGGAGCAGKNYTLCDDFEGAAPNTAGSDWTFITKGGYTVALDTTQFHSGKNSVRATFTAGAGYAYISETKTFPATDWWVRAYMRFMAPKGGHQVFAGSDTSANEAMGNQMRPLNDMGGGTIAMNIRDTDKVADSGKMIPMGMWNCYEWHQTATTVDLYLDGTKIATATGAGWAGLGNTYIANVLGAERFEGGAAGDVWIDDVAVNMTQIGCN